MSLMSDGSGMREMVPGRVGLESTVMAHAPACSAILACCGVETWKMHPPRRVWATPTLKEYGFCFGSVMTVVL